MGRDSPNPARQEEAFLLLGFPPLVLPAFELQAKPHFSLQTRVLLEGPLAPL